MQNRLNLRGQLGRERTAWYNNIDTAQKNFQPSPGGRDWSGGNRGYWCVNEKMGQARNRELIRLPSLGGCDWSGGNRGYWCVNERMRQARNRELIRLPLLGGRDELTQGRPMRGARRKERGAALPRPTVGEERCWRRLM